MVIIRLSRAGSKKRPFYHIVVIDSRKRRDGKYLDCAGYFNPIAKGQEVSLKLDIPMIEKWVGLGAQMSDKASYLVKKYCKDNALDFSHSAKPKAKAKKLLSQALIKKQALLQRKQLRNSVFGAKSHLFG